ncbi:MAG: DUF1311 domain-containing protein [Blastocatellia bacterium]|nr:DUF1311 domain-containing protein [Blastocatellia bacterium]
MKVLARDLEGTLISNAVSQIARPGLFDFLEDCRKLFPGIVIFTSVNEERFRSIAKLLTTEGYAPNWFADIEYITWSGETKNLIFVDGASPEEILLVDDYVHPGQDNQWIKVPNFDYPYSDAEYVRQDRKLNDAYKKLMGMLKPARQKGLREAERLWLAYTKANCDFIGDPDGGTAATLNMNGCYWEATAARAAELEGLAEQRQIGRVVAVIILQLRQTPDSRTPDSQTPELQTPDSRTPDSETQMPGAMSTFSFSGSEIRAAGNVSGKKGAFGKFVFDV